MSYYISDGWLDTLANLESFPAQKPWRVKPSPAMSDVAPKSKRRFQGKDISGQTFNLLSPRHAVRLYGLIYWECDCACGRSTTVNGADIRSGRTKSCGCLKNKARVDMVGKQFGKLTVFSEVPKKNGRKDHLWKCRCTCGNEILVRGQSLRSGNTTSCGCHRQRAAEVRASHQSRKSDGRFMPQRNL